MDGASDCLPEGWCRAWSKTKNKYYYWHKTRHEATWTLPGCDGRAGKCSGSNAPKVLQQKSSGSNPAEPAKSGAVEATGAAVEATGSSTEKELNAEKELIAETQDSSVAKPASPRINTQELPTISTRDALPAAKRPPGLELPAERKPAGPGATGTTGTGDAFTVPQARRLATVLRQRGNSGDHVAMRAAFEAVTQAHETGYERGKLWSEPCAERLWKSWIAARYENFIGDGIVSCEWHSVSARAPVAAPRPP